MEPLLLYYPYDLVNYENQLSELIIECGNVQNNMLNNLKTCYLYNAIRTIDYFSQPLYVDTTYERMDDLKELYDSILELYEHVNAKASGGSFVKNPLERRIIQMIDYQKFLANPIPGKIIFNLGIHRLTFSNMYDEQFPRISDPDCLENTRLAIRMLKDCYVDIMTIRLDQLRTYLKQYQTNPNQQNTNLIITALNDLKTSLTFQIIVRDYDAYIVKQILGQDLEQSHLNFRNKLIAPINEVNEIIKKFKYQESINSKLLNKFLSEVQNYLDTTTHGQLN